MLWLFLYAVFSSLIDLKTGKVPDRATPQFCLRESLLIFQVVFPLGFCLISSSLSSTSNTWRLEMPRSGWPFSGHCSTKETFRTGEVGLSDWNWFDLQPDRLRLYGSLQSWITWYDKSLFGCVFHGLHYQSHINEGTPVHTTKGGNVGSAGSNGLWGNLVVVENNVCQGWLAHLSTITGSKGNTLHFREVGGVTWNIDNSTGAHFRSGIKQKTGGNIYVLLTLQLFWTGDEYINIGYSS